MKIRLQNGMLYNALEGDVYPSNVTYDDETGKILSIGDDASAVDKVIDVQRNWILPAFIDMHVHLRDPGFTQKETLASGVQSAAAGGFSHVACMPNTNPPVDNPNIVQDIVKRAHSLHKSSVHPIACITVGQRGEVLTDAAALKASGAIALSDDGKGVQHGARMLEAMRAAKACNMPIIIHSEDETLSLDGVLHPNAAERIGLKALLPESEAAMIARDILLADRVGVHLHVCHVSTEASVALIRWAKSRGVRITAEVTPHHLLLDERAITHDDGKFKVNPPIQSERDRTACMEGFLDGTLDIIATDHAPHTTAEKSHGIAQAPFGMVGLELCFPLLYTHLVKSGIVPLRRLVDAMAREPARLFGLSGGVIRPSSVADLTIVDIERERTVKPSEFYSRGRNTPFDGWNLTGWIQHTVVRGTTIFRDGEERIG